MCQLLRTHYYVTSASCNLIPNCYFHHHTYTNRNNYPNLALHNEDYLVYQRCRSHHMNSYLKRLHGGGWGGGSDLTLKLFLGAS